MQHNSPFLFSATMLTNSFHIDTGITSDRLAIVYKSFLFLFLFFWAPSCLLTIIELKNATICELLVPNVLMYSIFCYDLVVI